MFSIIIAMALLNIGPVMFGGTPGIISYFRAKGLLALVLDCTTCQVAMQEKARKKLSDGIGWWCPSCKSRKSLREKSFFSKSRLTLQQWMLLLFFWTDEKIVLKAAKHAKVSAVTSINVYQWFREVCSERLLRDGPPLLGGPGKVVQIDESCFRHKPKHHHGQ